MHIEKRTRETICMARLGLNPALRIERLSSRISQVAWAAFQFGRSPHTTLISQELQRMGFTPLPEARARKGSNAPTSVFFLIKSAESHEKKRLEFLASKKCKRVRKNMKKKGDRDGG